MAGMGPPPQQHRRRRNATVAMTKLPAEGRQKTAPRWPLGEDIETRARLTVARRKVADLEERQAAGEPINEAALTRLQERVEVLEEIVATQTDAEKRMWRELWKTPQAVAWARLRWYREVAQYVRWKFHAENGNLKAGAEARQLGDRLGLTPLAMLRLRWEVAGDELDDKRKENTTPPPAPQRPDLKAVDPGAVAGS
ncbi:hypothetical protein [Prauserella muralis]|uniref:Uncharacterized protein n=1 Tax=Prauserella muralis TaxID=588067 RepID=A0A2V4APT4_9PSEU|nr:hypothetical protein [Prauserella muralis]PXY21136.1 hypothetical protein BAY60_27095 [Prauserella muralis]TWE30224.1 hypothetical protein FHX69_2921 [Prauserella muralis]